MSENKSLLLRLSPELKDRLQQAADTSNRTLTAEVRHRLEQSFESPKGYPAASAPAPHTSGETRPLFGAEKSPDGITDTDRAFLSLYRQLPPTMTQPI